MSTCERYEELISLSVSGELSGSEKEELRAHLAGCEDCRVILAREQRLWDMIERSRRAEQAPAGLADRLVTSAGREALPVARPLRRRRWWKWAAAAAAVLLGLFLLGRSGRQKPVMVARVTSGKLLVHDGRAWNSTREVYSGQLCRVAPETGSEARLDLADGSRVRLERGMAFLLHRGLSRDVRGERTVELLSGALTADVAKDKKENFVVDAPGGRVTATGTRFWVRAGPPEGRERIVGKKDIIAGAMATALAVAVFEGSVLVDVKEASAAQPVAIRAGEETKPVDPEKGKPTVGPRTVASAIPADALLFASAAGRAHWLKAVEGSALGAAYREEKVKAFVKPLIDRAELLIRDQKARIERNLMQTLKFSEIEAALQGEVGVAIVGMKEVEKGPEGERVEQKPLFLFVAEVGEHAEAFETGMGEFIKRVQLLLEQEGGGKLASHTARTYRGTDLRTFGVEKNKIHYARSKGYFLLAFDGRSVEKAIDCLEGKARSLATAAGIENSGGDLFKLSLDARAWMKIERGKKPDAKHWRDFANLGIDRAERVNYVLRFEGPLFREKLDVKLAGAGGVLALLKHARPVDAARLAVDAPASSMGFMALKLPTDRIIPTLLKVFDDRDPRMARNVRKGLVDMKTFGLDVEALLADALSGEICAYAVPRPGIPIPDLVAVAGLKSDRGVLDGLRTLATFFVHQHCRKLSLSTTPEGKPYVDYNKLKGLMDRLMPRVVDYRGGKLLYVPVQNRRPDQMIPAMILLKNKLIVASTDAAAKRAAARLGTPGSLATSKAFAAGLKSLPSGPVGVQYTDASQVFTMAYALVSAQAPRWRVFRKLDLQPGKLPPAAPIAGHLKPEVTALYAGEKNVTLEAITNFPRGAVFAGAVIREERRKKDAAARPPAGGPEPGGGPREDTAPEPAAGADEF